MTPTGLDSNLSAFLAFTFLLVVTPGSTTAVVVRHALEGGGRSGAAAACGAALGNALHATFAGVGLSVLVARWPVLLQVVRVAGAGYLAWLGVQSVTRAWRERDGGIRFADDAALRATPTATGRSFRDGAAINLLSPAIMTYYIVVVPTFIPPAAPRWFFAMLAGLHIAMAFACHTLWALAFHRVRLVFRPPTARRLLEAGTGLALIALAVRVFMG